MDTEAVILAGGYSSRADGYKMELELAGKPILQHVIDAFVPICTHIIVVGGYQMERLYPLVEGYENKVSLVYNREYPKGMFSSVKKGIAQVKSPQFFLTPGDCPFITTDLCLQLLEYSGQIVKPTYHDKGGHPILLPYESIQEILAEGEDSNLSLYLEKKTIVRVAVQEKNILLDVDTPNDYEMAKAIKAK